MTSLSSYAQKQQCCCYCCFIFILLLYLFILYFQYTHFDNGEAKSRFEGLNCYLSLAPLLYTQYFSNRSGCLQLGQTVATPAMGQGLSSPKMPLSPYRETYWSRIRRRIVRNFQILIVSAVKICKQCLQTVSASPDLLPRFRPQTPSVRQSPWAIDPK